MRSLSKDKLENLLNTIIGEINQYANYQLEYLDDLIEIAVALSSEKDLNNIFELILNTAMRFTNCDGASIYMLSEDEKHLDFKMLMNKSMKIKKGGRFGKIDWPSVPLYDHNGEKCIKTAASQVFHNGTRYLIEDVYEQSLFDYHGTQKYDKDNKYRTKSLAVYPLKNHEDDILGILQLINATDNDKAIISFTSEHDTFLTALTSLTAIALSNRYLIKSLKQLFFDFIKAIAKALDKKSKYTSGHISRVAELSKTIALKLNTFKHRNYEGVYFSDQEIEELSLAAWMHDIGKIVTPLHIMDKSTKLETVFDRIELVKTRFKLVKKVIEFDIERSDDERIKNNLNQIIRQLNEYEKFIEYINQGSEFIDDVSIIEIEEIASFSYKSKGEEYFLLTEEEKRNLMIRRGTLLPEEIEVMRNHVTITKDMLNEITYPKNLRNLPMYASAHHEKLNGEGYPDHLVEWQIPLQARIIALADFFEALTARDRPYKHGKTLSETLRIIAFNAKENAIDPRLFEFFMDSGIIIDFAKKHLNSNQIDDFDIKEIKRIFS